MFGIMSTYRFYEKVRSDFAVVEKDIADPVAAMNCILSLYHLHEWVWARWLKQRASVQAQLGIKKKCEFVAWLDANCPHFSLLQLLANGSKHCFPVHSTEIVKFLEILLRFAGSCGLTAERAVQFRRALL